MRVALSLTVLLTLGLGTAIGLGALPIDTSAVRQAAVALLAPAPPPPRPAVAPVAVTVATAEASDVPIYLSGIGTVQAYNTVSLRSRVDGEITQVLFTEGQDTEGQDADAGDPVMAIDPRPYQARLDQARATLVKDQATLKGALLDLSRYSTLVLKDFASRQQVDQETALVATKAQIVNDAAQIAYAQTELDYSTIRSPIEGRIGIRQVDGGNFVHAADTNPLVTITQLRPISVAFTLPAAAEYENVVVAYRNGAPVRMRDVGRTVDGAEHDELAGWFNGKPAVILDIQRQPGASLGQAVAALHRAERGVCSQPRLVAAPPDGGRACDAAHPGCIGPAV